MSEMKENRLKIIGSVAEVSRFRDEAKGAQVKYKSDCTNPDPRFVMTTPQLLCFDKFCPVPDRLRHRQRLGTDEAERAGLPSDSFCNDSNESGGQWELENWGCMYGPLNCVIIDPSRDAALEYLFETLDYVPTEALRKISSLWPRLSFDLWWLAEAEGWATEHLYTFDAGVVRKCCLLEEKLD